MKLTTTLNILKQHCNHDLKYISECLVGDYDENDEINLLSILEEAGVHCFFFALAIHEKHSQSHKRKKRGHQQKIPVVEIAIDCAELVLPMFEKQYPDDGRPMRAINAAKSLVASQETASSEKKYPFVWATIVAALGTQSAVDKSEFADQALAARSAMNAAYAAHANEYRLSKSLAIDYARNAAIYAQSALCCEIEDIKAEEKIKAIIRKHLTCEE